MFQKVQTYGVPVWQSRAPALREYVGRITEMVGEELAKVSRLSSFPYLHCTELNPGDHYQRCTRHHGVLDTRQAVRAEAPGAICLYTHLVAPSERDARARW